MAKYLYLDTSSELSLIMLVCDGKVLDLRSNSMQKDHASLINVHIAELLTAQNLQMTDLSGVFVLNGPGSYTGLRISLATAKGICYARQIPLYLLNKLDLIFYVSPSALRKETNLVAIKAREAEFFFATYDLNGESIHEPGLSTSEELSGLLAPNACNLFYIDDKMQVEWPSGIMVEMQPESIASFIQHRMQTEKPADLFLSEPFYMKNVHINKINKL